MYRPEQSLQIMKAISAKYFPNSSVTQETPDKLIVIKDENETILATFDRHRNLLNVLTPTGMTTAHFDGENLFLLIENNYVLASSFVMTEKMKTLSKYFPNCTPAIQFLPDGRQIFVVAQNLFDLNTIVARMNERGEAAFYSDMAIGQRPHQAFFQGYGRLPIIPEDHSTTGWYADSLRTIQQPNPSPTRARAEPRPGSNHCTK